MNHIYITLYLSSFSAWDFLFFMYHATVSIQKVQNCKELFLKYTQITNTVPTVLCEIYLQTYPVSVLYYNMKHVKSQTILSQHLYHHICKL